MNPSDRKKSLLATALLFFFSLILSGCDDIHYSSQKQMKNGNFTSLIAALFSSPAYMARGLNFIDEDIDEGDIQGSLMILKAADESQLAYYEIWLGTTPTEPVENLGTCPPAFSMDYTMFLVPYRNYVSLNANYILVYSVNNEAQRLPKPAVLEIPDLVLRQVDEINTTSASNPRSLTVYNNILYFGAYDGSIDKLWAYYGYPSDTTVQIGPAADYQSPDSLHVHNNQLYFCASDTMGTTGYELYRFDETYGFQLAADIAYGASIDSYPRYLTTFQDRLFFQANNYSYGTELFMYSNTFPIIDPPLVFDMYPGGVSIPNSSMPEDLTVYNNMLYFSANDGAVGRELFVYDGGPFPPRWVANINSAAGSDPLFLTVYNGLLFFTADDGTGDGRQLFSYNSLSATLNKIPFGNNIFNPSDLVVYNGMLYFRATDNTPQSELWAYRPDLGIHLALNIDNDTASSNPGNMTVFDNKLYFTAFYGATQYLWVYDSARLIDWVTNPRRVGNQPFTTTGPMKVFNNRNRATLCIPGSPGTSNYELWEHYIR